MLPGGFPGDLMARGRGGFPRGGRGGPPAGFPPRGLAPPFIGGRGGGRGGRGRGGPPGAYGRPRGEEPCFNIGGEEEKGDEEEGEEVGVPDEAGNIEIVDQEPVEKQQLQVVPVPVGGIGEQVAVEDEKVQAVVEAVAALGVGEQEE